MGAEPTVSREQRSGGHPRMSAVSDAELAERAAAGDRDAFGELVMRHAASARRAARAVLADAQDAEDAAQDGFLAAWRAITDFDRARPFRPWLMRIVVNAARDLLRRRIVRKVEPLPDHAPSTTASPERDTERALLRERIRVALARLPERQRVAVTLFDAEGYSHAEIAVVLGVAEGTVRSDVFHARRALRATLAEYREGTV